MEDEAEAIAVLNRFLASLGKKSERLVRDDDRGPNVSVWGAGANVSGGGHCECGGVWGPMRVGGGGGGQCECGGPL